MLKIYLAAWRNIPLYVVIPLLTLLLAADRGYAVGLWPSLLLATFYWALMLVRLKLDSWTVVIMTLVMPVFWWWYMHTNHTQFAQDIRGHSEYIRYISDNWSLPRPDKGWLFYHPPLYYMLGAVFYTLALWFDPTQPYEFVRLLSLYSFLLFLVYGVFTLRLAGLRQEIYHLCVVMVVFWPAGIMFSSKIDSNILLYTTCMASFYYLVRWYKWLAAQDLQYALLWLAVAIITRSNSLVMIATIGCVVAYTLVRRRIAWSSLFTSRFMLCALCLVLALSLNFGRTLYLHIAEHSSMPLIIGNSETIDHVSWLRIDNAPEHFLTFDMEKYLTHPFIHPQGDDSGRRNFWNALFKTSLWGEYNFDAVGYVHIANILLLVLAVWTLLPIAFYRREEWDERLPYLLLVGISVMALMVNRYQIPIMPSGDVRYLYFMIVGMAVLFGYAMEMLAARRYYVIVAVGVSVALTLLLCADAVYMMQT